jgi:hypothetical protein
MTSLTLVCLAPVIVSFYGKAGKTFAHVKNRELDGPHGTFNARIYRPTDVCSFMGGGFVVNRMENYDPMRSKIAAVRL